MVDMHVALETLPIGIIGSDIGTRNLNTSDIVDISFVTYNVRVRWKDLILVDNKK